MIYTFKKYETTASLGFNKKAYLIHLKNDDFFVVGGENISNDDSIEIGKIEKFDFHDVDESDFDLDCQPFSSIVQYFECRQKSLLESAFKAGYQNRANQSGLPYDELSEQFSESQFAEWFSFHFDGS